MFEPSAEVKVAVVGSIVFDIAVELDRVPQTHETVLARSAHISAGGKGLCQAVAAQRLGASVDLIGLIGDDVFGDYLVGVMDDERIGHDHVHVHEAGTHLGIPIITPDGNNRIIGVPQASFAVSPADLNGLDSLLGSVDVLLVQNETPLDTVLAAVELVGNQTLVVWNPAPARFSLGDMLGGDSQNRIAWLTPNESEASALADMNVDGVESGLEAAQFIHERFSNSGVVVTLGSQGAVAVDRTGESHVAVPHAVNAVDPTGAGDTFTAAFSVSLAKDGSVPDALAFASAAGALAATRLGAVTSIPFLAQVREFMDQGVLA